MEKVNYEQTISEIKELIKEKEFLKALEICDKDEFKNVERIQSEKLFILNKKIEDIDKAYETWYKIRNTANSNIIINGIDILMKLNRLEEALEYANKHELDDIKYIRLKLKLLVALNKKDEAKEIVNDSRYIDDETVKKVARRLEISKEEIEIDEVTTILTRIYIGNISCEEIKNSKIDSYIKSVLLIAYYEKHNRKAGISFIKELKKVNLPDKYKKVYNSLEQRLLVKNNYFDVTIYIKFTGKHINSDLVNEYNRKAQEEKVTDTAYVVDNKNIEVEKVENKKQQTKRIVKYAEVIGTRVNNRYNNINSNKNNINNNQKHVVLIKDELANELNDLGLYLYVMMQNAETRKDAIRAWDNLENMAYKPITDKKALESLINIIIKVSNEHPEIVNSDNKKLMKLLEK